MKNFTLTLLAFLLIQQCSIHKISCTTADTSQNSSDEDSPLSADNLLRVSATNTVSDSTDHNSYNSTSSAHINEKKSERNQRTLYRRAGGHLRSDVSSTTTESTTASHNRVTESNYSNESSASREVIHPVNSNSIKNHKSYFRRKAKTTVQPSQNNSSSRHRERGSSSNKVINVTILDSLNSKEKNDTNDEENSLDFGLMAMSAAGEGSNRNTDDEELAKSSSRDTKKDERVKTLADQIAEGKYGLIEKEIFNKIPRAPGIISYKINPETPNDNEKTLGGLNKDEIWLAEDHLLVLKGGISNEKKKNHNEDDWSPIDDYEAPKRPVKIPLNPKVPPPFPVQLTENGPLQFIGHNQFSIFNPYTNETGLFANVDGHITPIGQANSDDTKNTPTRFGEVQSPAKDNVHEVIPPPPWLFHNKDVDLLKHFPFNLPLPDQALNKTEEFDEDDPSLFYPPPYSFVYKINYTNLAPVGPLVPGIILPPPPDFFSVYNPEEDRKPIKTPLDAYKRIKEIQLKNRLSATTTTTTESPPKSSTLSYIRDFTRKTKPTTSTISSENIYSTKTTTLRPAVYSTTLSQITSPKEIMNYKTHHYDTTTLRLHPVYLPTVVSTQLYSTTTITPIEPPAQNIKQFQKDYGTQHHPIYFEYFDARTANPIRGNPFVGPEYETSYVNGQPTTSSSTIQTPVQPIAVFNSPSKVNKKPKSFYPPQFISTTISPANVDAKYLFVTPKPDIFGTIIAPQKYPIATENPISYNTAIPVQKPLILKPVNKFEDEIAAIRHTLDFYNNNNNNNGGKYKHTQKPKVKAVYEFSFEASKHKNQQQEEFQPMLSYDQKNAHLSELIKTNSYFPTSTEPTVKYYRTKQSAVLPPKIKNLHLESSASPAPQSMMYGQKLRQQNLNYYVRPIFKEVVASPHPSQQSQKIIIYPSQSSHDIQSSSVPVDQHGYRINSKNIKYRNPQQHHQQQQQQQQQYYGPASEVASLLNDTLVNYKQPQRPINPYSEFIDLQRFPQNSPIHPPHARPQNSPPYPPPHIYQQQYPTHLSPQIPQQHNPIYNPYQRPIPQQQSHQNFHQSASHPSLDVVKYDYPLISQINPESVHITFYNRPLEKSENGK